MSQEHHFRIDMNELFLRIHDLQRKKEYCTTAERMQRKEVGLRSPLVSTLLEKDIDMDIAFSPSIASSVEVSGVICGAKFRIAEPMSWNGCLLIYAHGYRSEDHPLTAELDVEGECYQRLLSQGWMVASTSYRRTGVIISDAMEDIKNLRSFIVARYHRIPSVVLLEGQSMGGGICTRLAEREPNLFHGVLAIGAALMTREDKQNAEDLQCPLLNRPLIPILYLTNESELGPIEQYIRYARLQREEDNEDLIVPPALWTVSRPGHNWTNQHERYSAVTSLMKWLQFGTFITVRQKDNTCPIVYAPSTVQLTPHHEGSIVVGEGRVIDVNIRGILRTNFTEVDLQRLRISTFGLKFDVEILNHTYEVTYDVYPFVHTEKGELVAYIEPNYGYVLIGIFNVVSSENAALRMGRVQVNDVLKFRVKEKKTGRLAIEKLQISGNFLVNRRNVS